MNSSWSCVREVQFVFCTYQLLQCNNHNISSCLQEVFLKPQGSLNKHTPFPEFLKSQSYYTLITQTNLFGRNYDNHNDVINVSRVICTYFLSVQLLHIFVLLFRSRRGDQYHGRRIQQNKTVDQQGFKISTWPTSCQNEILQVYES